MTTSLLPIEIVGGGLAGLSLGLALRRADVPVTMIEAGDYPRHRVCGEFITGLATATRKRLGLAPFLADALQHREVAWFLSPAENPARVQQLPSPALGLSRCALDRRLAEAFVAAGGDLRVRTRASDLSPVAGRVLATGRRRGGSSWIGLKVHVRELALSRDLEFHLGDQAYVGLSRVEDGAVNVCGLFRRRDLCAKGVNLLLGYIQAAGLARLAERVAAAEADTASFCAVAAINFDQRILPSASVRLGDACAMIPPFTGNGMAMAFQSAEIALDPLLAYARGVRSWQEVSRDIHTSLRRNFRIRLTSAAVVHPFLLRPRRQRLLGALTRAHLLPLRPFYAALH